MNLRTKTIFLTFIIMITVLVLFSLIGVFKNGEQSVEGQLMSDACAEIAAYETLRAESDLDSVKEIIYSHILTRENDTNYLIAESILMIGELEDEIAFHNLDMDYYNSSFARILNRLMYVELMDATVYIEKEYYSKAKSSIVEAKHHLHDALYFSKGSMFDQEVSLLHKLNSLNMEKFSKEDINNCLVEAEKFI